MTKYTKLDSQDILDLLFHPRSEEPTEPIDRGVNININVSDNISLGCRFYIHSKKSPSIIYFHGNGEVTSEHDTIASYYLKQGWNLFVASYRGYGWSTGSPTASTLLSDAKELFSCVHTIFKEDGFDGPLFVMGRSLGSACALEVMIHYEDDLKGIILESGFSETLPLLQSLGVNIKGLGLHEEDGFKNLDKIAKIKKPTLLLHGSNDQIIPIRSAEKLQANGGARNKQFHVIPGADHNTMISVGGELYFLTIKKFIDDITGASDWRRKRKEYKTRI